MADMDREGGVPVLMKELLGAGLLHGDALTVTGKTVRENLRGVKPTGKGEVIRPIRWLWTSTPRLTVSWLPTRSRMATRSEPGLPLVNW